MPPHGRRVETVAAPRALAGLVSRSRRACAVAFDAESTPDQLEESSKPGRTTTDTVERDSSGPYDACEVSRCVEQAAGDCPPRDYRRRLRNGVRPRQRCRALAAVSPVRRA